MDTSHRKFKFLKATLLANATWIINSEIFVIYYFWTYKTNLPKENSLHGMFRLRFWSILSCSLLSAFCAVIIMKRKTNTQLKWVVKARTDLLIAVRCGWYRITASYLRLPKKISKTTANAFFINPTGNDSFALSRCQVPSSSYLNRKIFPFHLASKLGPPPIQYAGQK